MTTEIVIPLNFWDTESEAVITSWLVNTGTSVKKDALIAEIMTEKIQHEILAPASGTIRITKLVDEIIKKGDVIGEIV